MLQHCRRRLADAALTTRITCLINGGRCLSTDAPKERAIAREIGSSRFYKSVHVQELRDQHGYQILLDKLILKTPAKNPLFLPTKSLALSIAGEWEWQENRIKTYTMPLMSLAATAIDQPRPRPEIVQTLMRYIPTDSILCRHTHGPFAAEQNKHFDPVLSWINENVGLKLQPTSSIFGIELSTQEVEKMEEYLEKLDKWEMAAVEQLAGACKSVFIALAAAKGMVGVEEAMVLGRLEEEYQIADWGLVEGGHDIDIADMKVRVSAPIVFLKLLGKL